MFEEVERYTSQFVSNKDQMKANLAQAISGMVRIWINLYGDLPTAQTSEELEKAREALLSRGFVIPDVEPLPPTLKPEQRPDNFLLRVSRTGYQISVDSTGNNPRVFVDLGTISYATLKTRGYDIHFLDDMSIGSHKYSPNMTIVVAGDVETKEKENAIYRYASKHPVLGNLHNLVEQFTYEKMQSQYQEGLSQILDEHPELKP